MKKYFLVIAMFIASVATFAQDNKWGVGLNIGYGTDVSKPFLGVKGHYDMTEAFTVAASFNHYFKDTYEGVDVKFWDINADVHWNVLHGETFKFYPLVGLAYLHGKASDEENSNTDGFFGVNIGVGTQINLGANWGIGVEAKYQILKDVSQFVPMATVMYRF